jgi:phosphatidylinositol alpha-1,6-mannosyltransferase
MRILILTPSLFPVPGGLQRYTFNLAQSLAEKGNNVFVISLLGNPALNNTPANLSFLELQGWYEINSGFFAKVKQKSFFYFELSRQISKFQPEQIICTWWDPLGYLALTLALLKNIPFLSIAHGQEVMRLPENMVAKISKRILRKWVFSKSSAVVAVSQFTKDNVVKLGLKPERVNVIPNGLSDEYIADALNYFKENSRKILGLNGKIILQVGRLIPRKGHANALKALKIALSQVSQPIYYVVVGSGPQKQFLENQAEILGVKENVIFAGYIPDEMLHHYFSASDIVIMTSDNPQNPGDVEGFGIVYLEGYAHAKPVIGAKSGGVPDAIIQGETGFLVQPEDEWALAERIIYLLNNPDYAEKMGASNKILVKQKWNWDLLVGEFIELMKKTP